jgi:hypothetical protein
MSSPSCRQINHAFEVPAASDGQPQNKLGGARLGSIRFGAETPARQIGTVSRVTAPRHANG